MTLRTTAWLECDRCGFCSAVTGGIHNPRRRLKNWRNGPRVTPLRGRASQSSVDLCPKCVGEGYRIDAANRIRHASSLLPNPLSEKGKSTYETET